MSLDGAHDRPSCLDERMTRETLGNMEVNVKRCMMNCVGTSDQTSCWMSELKRIEGSSCPADTFSKWISTSLYMCLALHIIAVIVVDTCICNHANDYYSSHTVSYIGCTGWKYNFSIILPFGLGGSLCILGTAYSIIHFIVQNDTTCHDLASIVQMTMTGCAFSGKC